MVHWCGITSIPVEVKRERVEEWRWSCGVRRFQFAIFRFLHLVLESWLL